MIHKLPEYMGDPPPEKPIAFCAIGEKSLAMFTLRFKGEEFGEMYESQFVKDGDILLCAPEVFELPPWDYSYDSPRYGRPGEFMLGAIGGFYPIVTEPFDFKYSFLTGGIN